MTYIYTRPSLDLPVEPKKLKFGAIALLVVLLIAAAFMISAPKPKPTALATQPMTLELAGAKTEVLPKVSAKDNALTYSAVDHAIRGVQIDNAHIGHSMKMALVSDKNPIKRFFTYVERKYSFMGMLVGLAFIFTLFSFGFIRTSKGDLSNY